MRRDLNTVEQEFILKNNYIGYLGYIYRDRPFVVPVTYFYDKENNNIICYSNEGHKLRAMRLNGELSLCVTEIDSVNNWKSVVAYGTFQELEGSEAKAQLHSFTLGVKDLIIRNEHRELDFVSEFSSKIHEDQAPTVFLIHVYEVTGKLRLTSAKKK